MSPRRLEPPLLVAVPASRRRPSQGDVEGRLLQYCRRSTPRQCDGALLRAYYSIGEEVQYIYVYAVDPEESEIGGFWSFWLRRRPALKDRPRQD